MFRENELTEEIYYNKCSNEEKIVYNLLKQYKEEESNGVGILYHFSFESLTRKRRSPDATFKSKFRHHISIKPTQTHVFRILHEILRFLYKKCPIFPLSWPKLQIFESCSPPRGLSKKVEFSSLGQHEIL